MSWEDVSSLPGGKPTAGAFRGASEPIVAERKDWTLWERMSFFWRAPAEHPRSRIARRVILTPQYLYAERADGARGRVPLDDVHGVRSEGAFLVYGVRGAEDLILPARAECPVQRQIHDHLGEADVPLFTWRDHSIGLLILLGCVAALPFFHALDTLGPQLFHELGTLKQLLALALVLAGFYSLVGGRRIRIDRVGVRVAIGLFGQWVFVVPPDEVLQPQLKSRTVSSGKSQSRKPVRRGWELSLTLRSPRWLGGLPRRASVELGYYSYGVNGGSGRFPSKAQAKQAAIHDAERIQRMLGCEPARWR